MNTFHPFRLRLLAAAFSVGLGLAACNDEDVPVPQTEAGEQETELPDAWHDQRRTQPYPKETNEIVLNPPPFIVPEAMKTGERLQFALSRSASFAEDSTQVSEARPWCMYSPHRMLEPGTWYWRFRQADASGTSQGEWSAAYSFEIKPDIPVFVTPGAETFLESLPTCRLRLYCFLDADAEAARPDITSHEEYGKLIHRANTAIMYDYAGDPNPYDWDVTDKTKGYIHNLYQAAYLLPGNTTYKEKLAEVLRLMLSTPVSDDVLFRSNFASTNIAVIYAECYDMAYDLLTSAERTQAEAMMFRILSFYYPIQLGQEENHIFDNHFWQHNMRILFQCALLLHDHPQYGAYCREVLEYYYELWATRAPNGGFNLSGHWANGTGYFTANVMTLWYMPMLFNHLTDTDFLEHPWYQNAGKALVYSWPPNSVSAGFGDGGESDGTPDRQRVGFADFLARETGDGYASWYASQCATARVEDINLRFYRMVRRKSYEGSTLPAYAPKMAWYRDIGEVDIHSNLGGSDNMTLSFRSGPYGTNSHMGGNQNSFNLIFRGDYIYRIGGYYVGSGNRAYDLMCYRHSRGNNTILVNGIGQSFSQSSYGQVLRAMSGMNMAYCLGDASMAYRDTTTETRWVEAFQEAGLTQSVENGFGRTPLTKYRRHILVLYPRTVLIYDDLAASEPVTWQWMLHSPVQFSIRKDGNVLETVNEEQGFRTVTQQFSDLPPEMTQTDQTLVPITETPDPDYPPLWHLTSAYGSCATNRILTVIQVCADDEEPRAVRREGNVFRIGEYTVKAEMDGSLPAALTASSTGTRAVFSYSAENPVIEGSVYLRRTPYSALLYDEQNGSYAVTEQSDYVPADTRASVGR